MNKRVRHPLTTLFRVMLAATVLSLALGPALASATPSGPDCDMPCCIPFTPEPDFHHFVESAASTLTKDCCPSSTGVPCDLTQAPGEAQTPAVLQASSHFSAHEALGAAHGVSPDDAWPVPPHSLFRTATPPSAFPPLFLTHSTLLI